MAKINWEKTPPSTALLVSVILMALVNLVLAAIFAVIAVTAIFVVKFRFDKKRK